VVTPDGTATSADPFTATKPNIVLILTDDQRWDELQMPTVQSDLIGKGVNFVNGFVVNSLCCPSRTTILTGKYSHGTDVYSDGTPHGGFDTFKPEDGSTIATWLHGAGYRTGLVGKYLNGYKRSTASYVPAGWDRWVAAASGTYYNYTLSVDGSQVTYGSQAADYSTDVLASYATDFIQSAPPEQPLFLYFAPRAPHVPTIVPPRYKHACPDLQPLRPPSYNEADVSDKPAYIQALARLSRTQRAKVDADHRHHCQMLLAVDDAVQAIRGALEATGRLSTTLIVFASDNGIQFGEHRWTTKQVPYEESIRVPMVVRYDPMTRGTATASDDLLLNLDFAPTFAAAAGVAAPGAEGMDFLPLLTDPQHAWRSDFLEEHWSGRPTDPPAYCSVRNEHFIYVEYSTGEEEVYDLDADPYELQNVASDPSYAGVKAQLHDRMVQLCSPPPPDFNP
jgi:arylsulfatase A-like enzyme